MIDRVKIMIYLQSIMISERKTDIKRMNVKWLLTTKHQLFQLGGIIVRAEPIYEWNMLAHVTLMALTEGSSSGQTIFSIHIT